MSILGLSYQKTFNCRIVFFLNNAAVFPKTRTVVRGTGPKNGSNSFQSLSVEGDEPDLYYKLNQTKEPFLQPTHPDCPGYTNQSTDF